MRHTGPLRRRKHRDEKPFAVMVRDKNAKSTEVQASPDGSYLPTDIVYEHGFFPLDGFKAQPDKPFEVFDQRFTAARMAHDYLGVYQRLITSKQEQALEARG